ncbi:MAG: Guanylylate cyclase-domain-containing protein [Monoraphidium minutum]|nr:MAG: Guanylylate cyclase-domain-containing protein [Monoraphidium minutum]
MPPDSAAATAAACVSAAAAPATAPAEDDGRAHGALACGGALAAAGPVGGGGGAPAPPPPQRRASLDAAPPPPPEPPQFARCEVPHIPQRFSWDCGLACVLMTLRALGVGWQRARYKDLLRLCPTTSVWTIDLAHLLARFRAPVAFTTVTIGAHTSYAEEAFYAPQWGADAARVQRLFDAAPGAGISVSLRSMPLDELTALVAGGRHLAIVLVDKRVTDPWACAAAAAAAAAPAGSDSSESGSGSGSPGDARQRGGGGGRSTRTWQAYFDQTLGDPAKPSGPSRLGAGALEAGRRAFGTDEDLLIVELPPAPPAPGGDVSGGGECSGGGGA